MTKEIVVVGSLNLDLVATVDHHPHPSETVAGRRLDRFPGGKGANQAVAAALLAPRVFMIGRHGTDGFEGELLRALRTAGVDISGIAPTGGPSGVALVLVAEGSHAEQDRTGGENAIVVIAGANAALSPVDIRRHCDRISAASIVLTQLETPVGALEELLRVAGPAGVPVVLDPAPARPLPDGVLPRLGWLTPNEIEAQSLLLGGRGHMSGAETCSHSRGMPSAIDDPRAAAERLLAMGPEHVLLKLGGRGAYLATRSGVREHLPAPEVTPVDTTAAGDCLNGALASALVDGATAVEAARFGIAAAALSVTRAGAIPSLPTRSEIERFRRTARYAEG